MAIVLEWPSKGFAGREQRHLRESERLAHLIARAGARRVLSLLKWLPAEQRADLIDLLLSEPAVVHTPHGKIRFLNHSGTGYWRARAIMTKEPGSLEWIDSMVPGSVFWDIGANIGVLTLYAAMRGDLKGGALLHLQRKQEAGSKTGEFPINSGCSGLHYR